MKLDRNDIAILRVLLDDGRESLSSIARKTSLTTPTVSYHFSRMVKSGLIKKFAPVLDQSMVRPGVSAFVTLKVKVGDANRVSRRVSAIGGVSGVFVTTGESNMTLKVNCADSLELQDLLNTKLSKVIDDGEVVSSQLILDAVKDEQPVVLPGDIAVKLRCDYCEGEVASDRPYHVRVGSMYHYFCCRTCRRSYLEKYGSRIRRINAVRETPLRS